ncbi:hypothetical protein ACIHFD_04320 [Nonomuraea sp. NPDC051941]|uniref:hypothetical protein n=1 Tax=Nonomuraea sp. NPDC051941 TaxID=3364373 RepID=UPI0037C504CD
MDTIIEAEFDLDSDALGDERGTGQVMDILGDEDIRLALRRNRIALAKGPSTVVHGDEGLAGYDVPLTCAVHSDPRCRFQWSRLMVDLTPTPQARISDMVPREVVDDRPVELTTTIGVGLKFHVVPNVLSADLTPQYSHKRTVYYPQIVSSGTGFTRGYWDFLALDKGYLHADRDLRLLVAAPAGEPVTARFQLRAKVRMAGVAGLLPLLARSGSIDGEHRLDQ